MDTSFTETENELPNPIPPRQSRRRSSSSPEIPPTPNKRTKTIRAFKEPLPVSTTVTPPASETPKNTGAVAPPCEHLWSDHPIHFRCVCSGSGRRRTGHFHGYQWCSRAYWLRLGSGNRRHHHTKGTSEHHTRSNADYHPTASVELRAVPALQLGGAGSPRWRRHPHHHGFQRQNLSSASPANWRIAAYRGGKLDDAVRILEKCPIPTHVKTLVIIIRINNWAIESLPLINSVGRLRDLLERQPRRTILHTVPYFELQPLANFRSQPSNMTETIKP